MPIELVDLDAVVSEDREVLMGGNTYRIPGSPPMEWYLWQRQFLTRIGKPDAQVTDRDIDEAHRKVLELIQVRHPKQTALPNVSPEHCFRFINTAYAVSGDDVPPPRRTRGGSASRRTGSPRRSST